MDSLTLQYILVAVVFLLACLYIIRMIKKNFLPKKFSSKNGCEKDCGCS